MHDDATEKDLMIEVVTRQPIRHLPCRTGLECCPALCSHAIDREAPVKSFLREVGVPAYTMFKSGFSGAMPDVLASIQRYDPDLAQKRLPEAGFPDGKGFPKLDFWLRNTFTAPAFGRSSSGGTR